MSATPQVQVRAPQLSIADVLAPFDALLSIGGIGLGYSIGCTRAWPPHPRAGQDHSVGPHRRMSTPALPAP